MGIASLLPFLTLLLLRRDSPHARRYSTPAQPSYPQAGSLFSTEKVFFSACKKRGFLHLANYAAFVLAKPKYRLSNIVQIANIATLEIISLTANSNELATNFVLSAILLAF